MAGRESKFLRDDGKIRFVCLKACRKNHKINSSKPGVGYQGFLALSLRKIRSQESEWLNVKSLSHSFVVNVGDSVKAWTNVGYRSVEHRVVTSLSYSRN
ncbi:hypothetical protein SUGI_0852580 [Cryptomeria japonica]|nr:hypothetical protein SUGI_0852580 [Cryptomeria japonica]